jgi:hypothetical protein
VDQFGPETLAVDELTYLRRQNYRPVTTTGAADPNRQIVAALSLVTGQ